MAVQPAPPSGFYGWIILALLLLIKLLKVPGQANVLAVTTPFIVEDLGLDTQSYGTTFAAATLIGALFQPLFGLLLDRAGARLCIPLGLVLLGGGLLWLSQARGTVPLLLAFILLRATAIGCLEAWPSAVVAVWFRRYRGRAIAAMMFVGGLPAGMAAELMERGDEVIGWRWTHAVCGWVLGALALLCLLLLRNKPEDVGQQPDGDAQSEADAPAAKPAAPADTEAGAAGESPAEGRADAAEEGRFCSGALALLYLAMFTTTAICGGIDIFTATIAHAHGSEIDVAALVFMPMGLVTSACGLLAGVLLDRRVPPSALAALGLAVLGPCSLLANCIGSVAGALAYGLLRGAAAGVLLPALVYAYSHYFGTRRIGLVLGGNSFCMVLGTAFGARIVGASPALFGSFAPALALLALPAVVLAAILPFLPRFLPAAPGGPRGRPCRGGGGLCCRRFLRSLRGTRATTSAAAATVGGSSGAARRRWPDASERSADGNVLGEEEALSQSPTLENVPALAAQARAAKDEVPPWVAPAGGSSAEP